MSHPFKVWTEDHIDDNTPLGDLARDLRSDPDFPPDGDRRDLLPYLAGRGADGAALDLFEKAWELCYPIAFHPFVSWLCRQGNPVFETLVTDYAELFPTMGSREVLRAVVENDEREPDPTQHDPLAVFDEAWQKFRPTCEAPDCTQTVGYQMSLCAVHAPLKELL